MSIPSISVITVNYNSSVFTLKLINSINRFIRDYVDEIVIIDNNSRQTDKDALSKLANKAKIFFNDENIGFSKAVNQAIKCAKNDYLLLLNPDCQIIDASISKLINLLVSDQSIGACGGALIDPINHHVVPSANNKPTFLTGVFEFTNLKKIFPNNIFTRQFWIEKKSHTRSFYEVSSLCGAFILFRKKISGQYLSFDESYFMYLEDVQFGMDLNKKGLKVIFDPNVKVIHHGGKSNNSKYKTVLKYWYNSRKIFFKKNLPQLQGKLLQVLFTVEEFLLKTYHFLLNKPNE